MFEMEYTTCISMNMWVLFAFKFEIIIETRHHNYLCALNNNNNKKKIINEYAYESIRSVDENIRKNKIKDTSIIIIKQTK